MTETSGYDEGSARPAEPATESAAETAVDEETGLPARGSPESAGRDDPEVEPG